jgi:levansucrase
LALYFTAAGHRGEPELGFDQRLFACAIDLGIDGRPVGRGRPVELVRPDGRTYQSDMAGGGAVGTIKAFRDPFLFRDPMTGEDFVLFAASRAGARSAWNGLIGAAALAGGFWTLHQPWVDAVGVNNELERPHLIFHQGRPHLFWSTQRKVFAPELRHAPTGLYGIVAERLGAPWRLINGNGLVLANPESAPAQAYSWQVLPDLSVWSFADRLEADDHEPSYGEARRDFAGAPAPVLQLVLEGDRAWLV